MVEADLVILNGKIATVNASFDFEQAVAVKNGWIIDVGYNQLIRQYIGPKTEVIDLMEKVMLPGTHDAHMHGVHTGLSLSPGFIDVSFPKVRNLSDLHNILAEAVKVAEPGEWIMGMGWNEALIDECVTEGRALKKWDLDSATPDHPVFLNDYGAHRMVVNSKALEVCGINEQTRDLKTEEGFIERVPGTMEPTGFLNDWGAQVLVSKHAPKVSREGLKDCIRRMNFELNKNGITSHVDILGVGGNDLICGTWGEKSIKVYEEMARDEELTARVSINVLAGINGIQSYDSIISGLAQTKLPKFFDSNWVKADTVKIFGDSGGWLRNDNTIVGSKSRSTFPGETEEEQKEEIIKTIVEVHRQGWQLGIHAIGGETIDTCIKGYIEAQQLYPREQPRHFIIHGDDFNKNNAEIAAKYGIGLSVQSIAGYNILDFMKTKFVSERVAELFSLREYQEKGLIIANGSDSNIFSLNWRMGVQFLVTRKTISGLVYRPDLVSTVEDAIRMYTINGAIQEHLENIRGSIEIGKVADFQVLNEDIFTCEPDKIGEIEVDMTIVNGKVVYKKESR
ncbi:amidohydrolase [Vagococcus sp. DIV0080]|uniref:Amidohydrolase n=1 Tax=Candidatus Vagococcus giribetii TaxID=2230876 RepID=A0ABS3HUI8_9ENTE|nr:amidohydrolase [Vagococcus sp. DIV0080]MBO0477415.1 amidohydrolase [Vagococcus sp. DIV0080]